MADAGSVRYRSRSGPWLAAAVWVLSAGVLVSFALQDEWVAVVRGILIALVIGVAAWMLMALPAVVVSADQVRLVNVVRDIRIPWSAITGLTSGYTLRIETTHGRYQAVAAAGDSQLKGLPGFTINQPRSINLLSIQQYERAEDIEDEDLRRALAGDLEEDVTHSDSAVRAADAIVHGWRLAQASSRKQTSGLVPTSAATTESGGPTRFDAGGMSEAGQVVIRWHTGWLLTLAVLVVATVVAFVA